MIAFSRSCGLDAVCAERKCGATNLVCPVRPVQVPTLVCNDVMVRDVHIRGLWLDHIIRLVYYFLLLPVAGCNVAALGGSIQQKNNSELKDAAVRDST